MFNTTASHRVALRWSEWDVESWLHGWPMRLHVASVLYLATLRCGVKNSLQPWLMALCVASVLCLSHVPMLLSMS